MMATGAGMRGLRRSDPPLTIRDLRASRSPDLRVARYNCYDSAAADRYWIDG